MHLVKFQRSPSRSNSNLNNEYEAHDCFQSWVFTFSKRDGWHEKRQVHRKFSISNTYDKLKLTDAQRKGTPEKYLNMKEESGVCGRFTLTAEFQQIIDRFDIEVSMGGNEYHSNYNIAPTNSVVAVINDGMKNRLGYLKWGLVPSWAPDEKIGSKLINARAETAAEKTSFKQAFRKRRCLVVADSFYEWKKTAEGKVPYRIKLKSDDLFAMAGIWESWKSAEGNLLHTCSILTVEANKEMASLHNRMPVILRQDQEQAWLNPSVEKPAELQEMLTPYPDNQLEFYRVSQKVNSPKNNSPDLLRKAEG